MALRRVVLGDLPLAERERFFEFLVANKVEFIADQTGEQFVATIKVVPPAPTTARITGRARQATKQTVRRSQSANAAGQRKKASAGGAGNMPVQDAAATLKAAQSVLRRRYTRFCNLLPALMQPPKALQKAALVRFTEEVYESRYEKDSAFIKSEASGEGGIKVPQTFPDFVYDFAAKRYGLKALVSNNCWGMVSSVELLRGQHLGIDVFGKFIEETYDATDLLFFLFTRSAIERVMTRSEANKKGDAADERRSSVEDLEGSDTEEVVKPKDKKKSATNKFLAGQDYKMELKQVVQVVKMAIDSKRQDLRDQVIKKLDAAMAARTEGVHNKKAPTLEPDRLLAIATEAYHNSRDFKADVPEGKLALDKDAVALGEKVEGVSGLPREKDLAPEVKKEVRQVTQRLITSLSASGETDVNPQQVYDWALQVTLRRHKLGDFLEDSIGKPTSMTTQEMSMACLELLEMPGDKPADSLMASHEVLSLSPEAFEKNLEANVRQLLLNATSELVINAVASLPEKVWQDESAAAPIRSALIGEFAPVADILMEAIVSKDYQRWLDTLRIQGKGSSKHRQQFENLYEEFQTVLTTEITAPVVQQLCRAVVGADELISMVGGKADALSKPGKVKRLGDSSSDEDDDEDFGGDAF
jgi:hypothetical protein